MFPIICLSCLMRLAGREGASGSSLLSKTALSMQEPQKFWNSKIYALAHRQDLFLTGVSQNSAILAVFAVISCELSRVSW